MNFQWDKIFQIFQQEEFILNALDIFLVASILFLLLKFIRGTRSTHVLFGLCLAILVYVLSEVFQLQTLNWLLSHVLSSIVLIVIVLFQSDFRRMLASVGRSKLFNFKDSITDYRKLEDIFKASQQLSHSKTGALIILQGKEDLSDAVDQGVAIDAIVSKELIVSIFQEESPLHDGAVIINDSRLEYAACFLPMIFSDNIASRYGSRHRAAIALSNETDAIVIVVSEETGSLSLAQKGMLQSEITIDALKEQVYAFLDVNSKV